MNRRYRILRVMAGLCFGCLVFARAPVGVHAERYEVFIDIEDEEDLYELRNAGDIGDTTFETLLSLFQEGVNLNSADRERLFSLPNLSYAHVDKIIAFRENGGFISDPSVLVSGGVLDQRSFLAIAPFLIVQERSTGPFGLQGKIKHAYMMSNEDELPPAYLRITAAAANNVRVGLLGVMTQNQLGAVRYDGFRDALTADETTTHFHLPKAYVAWENAKASVVAGTYRVGFGQRLTFDNSWQKNPNGFLVDNRVYRDSSVLTSKCKESMGELAESPCAGEAGYVYVTSDFEWRDELLGAGAALKKLYLGPGTVQVYGFLSYQPNSVYQYAIYDRRACSDPRSDDAACSAPEVYRAQSDLFAPTSRYSYHTLPNMFVESTAGANVSYFQGHRAHVGVTAYASQIKWLVTEMKLDFQEWNRYPFGGGFGAVGADFAWGRGALDVFGEVARSFDSMPSGGGIAAILRSTLSWGDNEFESTLRHYSRDFANPHARPISALDFTEGNRARDETGLRLRLTHYPIEKLRLRLTSDLWQQNSSETTKGTLYARADVDTIPWLRWGVWGGYSNYDLKNGLLDTFRGLSDECISSAIAYDSLSPCVGRFYGAGRLRYQGFKKWYVDGQLKSTWWSDSETKNDLTQDLSAWLTAGFYPAPEMRLRARVRYLFEDVDNNARGEQSLWGYIDMTYVLQQRHRLRLRLDVAGLLDDRESSQLTQPDPATRVWLEAESRF